MSSFYEYVKVPRIPCLLDIFTSKLKIMRSGNLEDDILNPINNLKSSLTSKQIRRMEKKQKKMQAFLEITKLNDRDRQARKKLNETLLNSQDDHINNSDEPICKKYKIETKNEELDITTQETQDVPLGSSGAPKIFDPVEYQKLRAELRNRKNILKNIPRIRLKQPGMDASLSKKEDDRTPLFLSDLQDMLLFASLGNRAFSHPLTWCQIEKANRLSHILVLVVEGMSILDFFHHQESMPKLNSKFDTKIEVVTPSAYKGSLASELALYPLTNSQRQRLTRQYGSLPRALAHSGEVFRVFRALFPVMDASLKDKMNHSSGPPKNNSPYGNLPDGDQFPRTHLLLSPSQLIEHGYPVRMKGPLGARYMDYKLTKDCYEEVTPFSPMFAIDCEMCITSTNQNELTRISIVDENLEVIYDSLVKPYNAITNYLTRYSGITPQMLKNITTRLEDVQRDLRELIPPDAILIGQSLNFDLHALHMLHPYIIDTSVIFNVTGDPTRKSKLALLSSRFLGEDIQKASTGHLPSEDAAACMKLTKQKLKRSIEYGDAILAGNTTPVKEEIVTLKPKYEYQLASSLFNHIGQNKPAAIVAHQEILDEYACYLPAPKKPPKDRRSAKNKKGGRHNSGNNGSSPEQISTGISLSSVINNSQVIPRSCELARSHHLTVGHIRPTVEIPDQDICRSIDTWVGNLVESLEDHGLMIVLFGGRSGAGNGTCFFHLKRPPELPRQL